MKVESIFISDVHLGQSGCRAAELLEFLAEMDAKNIFVIGNLIDFWAMRRSLRRARRRTHSAAVAARRQLEGVRQELVHARRSQLAVLPGEVDTGVRVLREFVDSLAAAAAGRDRDRATLAIERPNCARPRRSRSPPHSCRADRPRSRRWCRYRSRLSRNGSRRRRGCPNTARARCGKPLARRRRAGRDRRSSR